MVLYNVRKRVFGSNPDNIVDAQNSGNCASGQLPWQVGVVSYLNARPLICGLEKDPAVRLQFDVPSRLTERLLRAEFDAALIPVADLLKHSAELRIISDACIGSDGETLTVRILSRVPPEQVRRIHLDQDSRTSAMLAKLVWPALFGNRVAFVSLEDPASIGQCESVLLIGDKVVHTDLSEFRYQVDLGSAWKTWTGLPFVFAVWAAPRRDKFGSLSKLLAAARDRGVRRAGQLAVEFGPAHGWPTPLAQQYLQRYLKFGLTDKYVEGMIRFFDLATAKGLVPDKKVLQGSR